MKTGCGTDGALHSTSQHTSYPPVERFIGFIKRLYTVYREIFAAVLREQLPRRGRLLKYPCDVVQLWLSHVCNCG